MVLQMENTIDLADLDNLIEHGLQEIFTNISFTQASVFSFVLWTAVPCPQMEQSMTPSCLRISAYMMLITLITLLILYRLSLHTHCTPPDMTKSYIKSMA